MNIVSYIFAKRFNAFDVSLMVGGGMLLTTSLNWGITAVLIVAGSLFSSYMETTLNK